MDGKKVIKSIRLENILSYGPDTPEFDLEPLNVIIGPNASGKSNLIEALSIVADTPNDIQEPIRKGGGTLEWLWKGTQKPVNATIEVTVDALWAPIPLRYRLSFTESISRFRLMDETVEDAYLSAPGNSPKSYYQYRGGKPVIRVMGETPSERPLKQDDLKTDQSILSQRRDPESFIELFFLGMRFERMRFYREFHLGQDSPLRRHQQADLTQDYLLEDGSNLAVVLSYLLNQPPMKAKILDCLQEFYPSVQDILAAVLGGNVQMSFHEEGLHHPIPSTRLSDGTLRYLCLLAVLFHPEYSSVICIEEPETGLHPDVIPAFANLLVEASKNVQIVVTTHSDILVDALSNTPEAVVICEKVNGATQLRRLNADDLKVWLEKYRLGELWTSGKLGGNLY